MVKRKRWSNNHKHTNPTRPQKTYPNECEVFRKREKTTFFCVDFSQRNGKVLYPYATLVSSVLLSGFRRTKVDKRSRFQKKKRGFLLRRKVPQKLDDWQRSQIKWCHFTQGKSSIDRENFGLDRKSRHNQRWVFLFALNIFRKITPCFWLFGNGDLKVEKSTK